MPGAPSHLVRQFQTYLSALELVSHGTATRPFADGARRERQGSRILRLDAEPYPHERLRALWEQATSLDAWEEVMAEARETLHNLRKSPPAPKAYRERGSVAWKRMIANDTETSVAALARRHGISRPTVYAYRRRYLTDEH
jgi:hypothetical protein